MKLFKPHWVNFKGKPLYSIDIHPDKTRFVTSGLGEDCGKIIVWSMKPLLSERDETSEDVAKILCQMDTHSGCVNCVRWSINGSRLASGSDDKIIIIWKKMEYSNKVCTASNSHPHSSSLSTSTSEVWRVEHMLRGHTGDVLDLAWSPHDIFLASASIDTTVIIWDAKSFPKVFKTITGHSGFVKGICWDPIGQYLASQGDDHSLRVWQTKDWKQQVSITRPFEECSGTTQFLRFGWSPDGHYIISAHALNNSGPTAQIVQRSGWKSDMDFVGHRKAITTVRFNPNILSKRIRQDSTYPRHFSCCALGSKDKTISIWLTALKRPLVVIKDLFRQTITDISWSRSGYELLACSIDGSVVFVQFQEKEIGAPLTSQQKCTVFKNVYGEDFDYLNLYYANNIRHDVEKQKSVMSSVECRPVGLEKKSLASRDRQIEVKDVNGKRRITPIFIGSFPYEDPSQFNDAAMNTSGIFFSSKGPGEKSKVVIEIVTVPSSQRGKGVATLSQQSISSSSTRIQTSPHSQGSVLCVTTSSQSKSALSSTSTPVTTKKTTTTTTAHSPSTASPGLNRNAFSFTTPPQKLAQLERKLSSSALSSTVLCVSRVILNSTHHIKVERKNLAGKENAMTFYEVTCVCNNKKKWATVFARNAVISRVVLSNVSVAVAFTTLLRASQSSLRVAFFSLSTGSRLSPDIVLVDGVNKKVLNICASSFHTLIVTSSFRAFAWKVYPQSLRLEACVSNCLLPIEPIKSKEIECVYNVSISNDGLIHFSYMSESGGGIERAATYTYEVNLKSWICCSPHDSPFPIFIKNLIGSPICNTNDNSLRKKNRNSRDDGEELKNDGCTTKRLSQHLQSLLCQKQHQHTPPPELVLSSYSQFFEGCSISSSNLIGQSILESEIEVALGKLTLNLPNRTNSLDQRVPENEDNLSWTKDHPYSSNFLHLKSLLISYVKLLIQVGNKAKIWELLFRLSSYPLTSFRKIIQEIVISLKTANKFVEHDSDEVSSQNVSFSDIIQKFGA